MSGSLLALTIRTCSSDIKKSILKYVSTRTSHPTERLVTGLVCAVLTEAPKRSDLDDSDEETEIHKMQMPALEMSQRPNFYFYLSRPRHRRAVLMPGTQAWVHRKPRSEPHGGEHGLGL